MSKFIKLSEQTRSGFTNTLYFNIDNIVAIHKERCLVYGSNGAGQDVFCLTPESMDKLIQVIEGMIMCQ